MKKEAFHPDHLEPGDLVGQWLIVQVLGRGGSSRLFKVERDGRPYTLKMSLLPVSGSLEELSDEQYVETKGVYRRLAREAAALFTYASHPNLLRLYAVDFWPSPTRGYPFLVTDYLDGDTWLQSPWRKRFHAAALVASFSDVVRTVGVLHARGVYHRDLKAENILIRREDGRPFLIDFGTVRLPGALTQTMGLPEGVLHLLPPEFLAWSRTEVWKQGKPFHGGLAVDLYALGVLLYQSLTGRPPFDPELPDNELVAAIATLPPVAPHLLNPQAPRALSDIAMKLLEKQPEERYPDTGALLQVLEEASGKERTSPDWKLPLLTEENLVEEAKREEKKEHAAWPRESTPEVQETRSLESTQAREEARQEETPPATRKGWWERRRLALLAGLVLLGALGLVSGRAILSHPPAAPDAPAIIQRGSPPVPHSTHPQDSTTSPRDSSFSSLLTVWLCATVNLGCPAAQVRPPPEPCPREAFLAMERLGMLDYAGVILATLDVNQPGTHYEEGIYRDGPIVSRVEQIDGDRQMLPAGTLLYGRLWTGPGIHSSRGEEAVAARYTEALLPNGDKVPVCLVLNTPRESSWEKKPGSKPGAARVSRQVLLTTSEEWMR